RRQSACGAAERLGFHPVGAILCAWQRNTEAEAGHVTAILSTGTAAVDRWMNRLTTPPLAVVV
ncbi:MAG: hypothetical protein WEH44_07460, partial [Pirellulaceae bacterium]